MYLSVIHNGLFVKVVCKKQAVSLYVPLFFVLNLLAFHCKKNELKGFSTLSCTRFGRSFRHDWMITRLFWMFVIISHSHITQLHNVMKKVSITYTLVHTVTCKSMSPWICRCTEINRFLRPTNCVAGQHPQTRYDHYDGDVLDLREIIKQNVLRWGSVLCNQYHILYIILLI